MFKLKTSQKCLFLIIISITLLASAPFYVRSKYITSFFSLLFLYLTLASAWNIIGGYAGQVCLGVGGFFGVGAYATMLSLIAGLPFYLSIILGGLAAICLALLTIPLFKLRGVYFSIGTLFLPDIVRTFVLYFGDITGGSKGVYLPFLRNPIFTYMFLLVISTCAILTTYFLTNSRYGFAIRAIRDDEDAAEMFGVNAVRLKLTCLIICAFYCGLAGSGFALYMGFLEPHSVFYLMWSIAPVFMCIIGGSGTIWGPIVGAIIYATLSEQLTYIVGEMHLLIFGSILIIVVLFAPYGIVGALKKIKFE